MEISLNKNKWEISAHGEFCLCSYSFVPIQRERESIRSEKNCNLSSVSIHDWTFGVSGLQIVYSIDEVAFIQNLVFYIEEAYRISVGLNSAC